MKDLIRNLYQKIYKELTLTTKILSDLSDNHFELVEVGDTGYTERNGTVHRRYGT